MRLTACHLYERAADDLALAAARPRPASYVGTGFINRTALDCAARGSQTRRHHASIDNHREHATHGRDALSRGGLDEQRHGVRGERRVKMQALAVFAPECEQAGGLLSGFDAFGRDAQRARAA